ncbi:peptide ABC transporter permease [Haloarcula hispanica N601]|uniref:Peptide ABC transporter permease n=4 Tax=Haloarcula TaxID=2237 RepID=V5TP47_HALHI|nr:MULTISPECIES: ABC transporter permease [Haloarcula]AEM58123.1 oligopeptide transport system permease protein OppC [Haloarcula hispanica ATCC 33960]AHB66863.1 peptide ABC transporter permease [Haloarcula hispanica N601]AJF25162.1 peptide ABC transporter permease [Haloarcula sp. CBA1115]EMA24098.1 oligopeptide transport system permease OppC [Haloarcula amylolytica JCM 13557]KAA9406217.1 ABC transporter permease [Haloarcula sp. CBA1131]
MSTERGRIRITGFDADRVESREPLSDWTEERDTETESRWERAWGEFRDNRSAMLGLYIVALMGILAVFARPVTIAGVTVQPFSLAPYDPSAILYVQGLDVSAYEAPSLAHPFGTDGSARDVFSRVLYGGRFSLSIGFIVVSITAAIGLVYGAIAGYYGGRIDEVMMRLLDLIFAFPGLLLALIIVAVLGKGYWELVLAFTVFGWAGYARLIRGEILKVKENEYVMAAKALGARDRRVIFRHVVPNAIAPLVVQASLSIGTVVIGVAALGFLGLGLPPGSAEWGTMLDATRETIVQGPGGTIPWWVTVFPGGAIFLFVMSMNLIGDGINDALNAQEGTDVATGGEV